MRLRVLFLTAAVSACTAQSPATFNAETPLRILETLSADDMQGRKTGSEGGRKAQAYLKTEIAKLDVFDAVYDSNFTTKPSKDKPDAPVFNGTNIHGLIDIEDGDKGPLFVITAHYDHLGQRDGKIYNGADDNASGVAALFAIAESFKNAPPNHDVLFIWFDAEEMGLAGARHYIDTAELEDRPVLNLNLDMISQNTVGELYASGAYHTPAVKPILVKAAKGSDINLKFGHDTPEEEQNDWTLQSDHGVFHRKAIPFVYFGVEDHPHYHKDSDTFETIPQAFYKSSILLIVNAAHALDENLGQLAKAPQ